jgi:hypothetical protein
MAMEDKTIKEFIMSKVASELEYFSLYSIERLIRKRMRFRRFRRQIDTQCTVRTMKVTDGTRAVARKLVLLKLASRPNFTRRAISSTPQV